MEEHVRSTCEKLRPAIKAIVGTEARRLAADAAAEWDTMGNAANKVSPIIHGSEFLRSYRWCEQGWISVNIQLLTNL